MIKYELTTLTTEPLVNYVLEDTVVFYPEDVFDKWGFADGDVLSDLWYEYMEKYKSVDFKKDQRFRGINIKPDPLFRVVEKCCMSKVEPIVTLEYIVTCHNGTRCYQDKVAFSPDLVLVSIADILKVFDEIYDEVTSVDQKE